MNPIAKAMMIGGVVLIILGLLWQFGGRFLHLGRLPGNFPFQLQYLLAGGPNGET
ncbi:MAG TPA: hypothetical protein DDY49_06380, partial [Paenibacillaceae bacterium]|nr:hypothetical protein [Paenibacillaceae bacterium]